MSVRKRNVMEATSEKLIRDVKTLVQDAEELIKATSGDFGDKTREARAKLAGALVVARETCHRLENQVISAAQTANTRMRQYPYQMIGAGFAIGLALGLLMMRRD